MMVPVLSSLSGNLYFANIQKQDENFNEKYACLNSITQLGVYTEGSYSYIEVQDGKIL